MDTSLIPRRHAHVLHYDVLDEMVVYCPKTRRAASFNCSAKAIWELCDGSRTIEEICATLSEATGYPVAKLQPDVEAAIRSLSQLDLVALGTPQDACSS
jgi:hypothetical protein